jgi:hypothetical protein
VRSFFCGETIFRGAEGHLLTARANNNPFSTFSNVNVRERMGRTLGAIELDGDGLSCSVKRGGVCSEFWGLVHGFDGVRARACDRLMGMRIDTGGMQVRLKAPKIGDVVTVRNTEVYFYLPEGLPHRTQAVLVGHAPGRYIVRALRRDWNIAMQCVEHEEEWFYAGQWLDKWDRRVRRAQALIDRLHALEKFKAGRRRG